MIRHRAAATLLAATVIAVGCGDASDDASDDADPTVGTLPTAEPVESTEPPDVPADDSGTVRVRIDATEPGEAISPLILGISGDLDETEMQDIGIRLNSWGGNPASRYNYEVGHLWNAAADWEFRNTDYESEGDSFRNFATRNRAADAVTRLAVPTLGWIAKDDTSCSFPDGEGGCVPPDDVDCENPGPIADPRTTSVESTPEMVASWVAGLAADGLAPRFIAMDNEPELWGFTHYDVHPECTTYEEVLSKYIEYASAVRAVAPDAELMGPVMCCWYDYWNIAPGPADGTGTDFLTWFLTNVRRHDETSGVRTLDVVDVHFYPQSDVFNDDVDEDTNARRLRSVRSLWDPDYADESWIPDAIEFIPRMKRTIEASYPGLPLAISEWNFGADGSMNGALAIADVLGVYGREGVYAAAYWRSPEPASPGYHAFKMHGNYDGQGSRFGGDVVSAVTSDEAVVGAYAALDPASGIVRVMLLNKDPDADHTVALSFAGFQPVARAERWTYGSDDPESIVASTVDVSVPVAVPAESITVLELEPAS